MNVNISYEDMMLPSVGPVNPFGDHARLANQNALAGHVEEHSMTEHAFRAQHLSHAILGYSANPSVDPSAPRVVGDAAAAEVNNFATLDVIRASHGSRKDLKRKRMPKGNLEIVEGDGAYIGPWAKWDGDDIRDDAPPQDEIDAMEAEDAAFIALEGEESEAIRIGKTKPKKGLHGSEKSIFHGKSLIDYQGRTYIDPPYGDAPQLSNEIGGQESFIPKTCIHTWTGHNGGVSVVRAFPQTGHLILSGGMDTKIKVCPLKLSIFAALT